MISKSTLKNIEEVFKSKFEEKPIQIFAPGRINIIGEHTDYNNGFVLPAAIDKGIFFLISKSKSNLTKIIALDKNESLEFDINQIENLKVKSWRKYLIGVLIELKKINKIVNPFNLVFSGNIPIGSGLSSSAALENGFLFSLNILFDLKLTKQKMIKISQQAEHNYVGVKCGIMDQFASMFGLKENLFLLDCKTGKEEIIPFKKSNIEIILINSNVKHDLAESAYNNRFKTCFKLSKLMKLESLREATHFDLESIKNKITIDEYQKGVFVINENMRVLKAVEEIKNKNFKNLGELLYESHQGLQYQYNVSCDEIDYLVNLTKEHSEILGSRIMGGGFGGCTINIVQKNSFKIINSIAKKYETKFNIKPDIIKVKIANGVKLIK